MQPPRRQPRPDRQWLRPDAAARLRAAERSDSREAGEGRRPSCARGALRAACAEGRAARAAPPARPGGRARRGTGRARAALREAPAVPRRVGVLDLAPPADRERLSRRRAAPARAQRCEPLEEDRRVSREPARAGGSKRPSCEPSSAPASPRSRPRRRRWSSSRTPSTSASRRSPARRDAGRHGEVLRPPRPQRAATAEPAEREAERVSVPARRSRSTGPRSSRSCPHRDPFLLLDEVIELEPGARVVARKLVTEEDCAGHFPGNPIMPGVKMVEALAQAGAVAVLSEPENRAGSRSSPASTTSASSASSGRATSSS